MECCLKVFVRCESPLLQRALELFLSDHLSAFKNADVVISDRKVKSAKKVIYIAAHGGADLEKPFSRSQLMLILEEFYVNQERIEQIQRLSLQLEDRTSFGGLMDGTFEERLETLTKNFVKDVVEIAKEHYAKGQ